MAFSRIWLIGSDPSCDLVVNRPNVSQSHCRLCQDADGTYWLEDLQSTNGTYVGGHRVSGSVRVQRTDTIFLGSNVPLPWPGSSDAFAPCTTGIPFSSGGPREIRIGREADNDVVLDFPMVSAYHARLIVRGNQWELEDLGSSNGTAVGSPEHKVTRTLLSPNDTVYFGSLRVPASRLLAGRSVLVSEAQPRQVVGSDRAVPDQKPASFQIAPGDTTPASIALPKNFRSMLVGGLGVGIIIVVVMVLRPPYRPLALQPPPTDPKPQAHAPEIPTSPLKSPTEVPSPKNSLPVVVAPSPPAWDNVVRPYEEAIVCIALEYKGYTFPYATGWIARADRIVTTGSVAAQLESVPNEGFRVVVHHRGRVEPIRAVRRHPRYNPSHPTELTSQRFNLGWLVPETGNVTPACLSASEEDWKGITIESHLLSLGIASSLGEKEPYDPLKVRMTRFPVRLTGSDPVPDEKVPLFKVAVTLPKTAEGSPVFNDRGRVIGVLAPVGSGITLVPTAGLSLLLD